LAKWDEGWRLSYGGNILFALILLVCLVFMPESPRWLAAHASEEDLAHAMTKVHYEDEVETETKKLLKEMEEEKELGVASWSEVFAKDNHVFLGMSFQAFQQVCTYPDSCYFQGAAFKVR
jgi:Sugar (and other) transporter